MHRLDRGDSSWTDRDRSPVAAAMIGGRPSKVRRCPSLERAATGDRSRSVWLRLSRVVHLVPSGGHSTAGSSLYRYGSAVARRVRDVGESGFPS